MGPSFPATPCGPDGAQAGKTEAWPLHCRHTITPSPHPGYEFASYSPTATREAGAEFHCYSGLLQETLLLENTNIEHSFSKGKPFPISSPWAVVGRGQARIYVTIVTHQR